ncbi:hypothetical protein F4811DRAFT_526512 [Daldinia bambusicola]|nr:hypothetical protein F4811DRAFT_526512 [Daldinia bambusicola]
MSFPSFPKFPAEVQDTIWKAYILEANKNRVLLMDNMTKHIMPTRSLTSPALYACVSSRKAYLDMHHIKLRVYRTFREPKFLDKVDFEESDDRLEEDTASDSSIGPHNLEPVGYIYVNMDRDIFLLSGFFQFDFKLEKLKLAENQRTTILFQTEYLPYRHRHTGIANS